MQYAPLPCLAVRESPAHGLGVFTSEAIPAGTVVERAAVLESLLDKRLPQCGMERYCYGSWEAFPHVFFMPSGFGTMYNDAQRCCNTFHTLDMNTRCLTFTTLRDVEAGEELFIDYGQNRRTDILHAP